MEEDRELMESSGNWEQEVLDQELGYKEHELLTLEVKNFKKLFGDDQVAIR